MFGGLEDDPRTPHDRRGATANVRARSNPLGPNGGHRAAPARAPRHRARDAALVDAAQLARREMGARLGRRGSALALAPVPLARQPRPPSLGAKIVGAEEAPELHGALEKLA